MAKHRQPRERRLRRRDNLYERSFRTCAGCGEDVYVLAVDCRGCGTAVAG